MKSISGGMWSGRRAVAVIAMLACVSVGASGCHSATAQTTNDAGAAAVLAPITVRDESNGFTFTYLALTGDFKVVRSVADVPYEARDAVRVWVDATTAGVSGPTTYAADLRTRRADGTYKVDVVPLSYFDDLAQKRRGQLAAAAAASAAPTPSSPDSPGAVADKGAVILYGAEWCKPCHAAEAYLKSKGILYVHKNVDDQVVEEELQDKLQAAGIRTNSIPVLDIGGKLLVGFSPDEVEQALAASRKAH